jgi:hypothetical protein
LDRRHRSVIIDGKKLCSHCKQQVSIEQFAKRQTAYCGYNSTCKICVQAQRTTYWKANPEERIKYLARHRSYHHRERLEVLQYYSHSTVPYCACCGESQYEFLSIDHIHGGGYQHMKTIKSNLDRWLKRQGFPKGYRVLCYNCNFVRGHYGYCPHEKKGAVAA